MDNKLVVSRKKKQIIVEELRKREYEAFPKSPENKKTKSEDEEPEGDEGEDAEVDNDSGARDYDYLLGVRTHS
jgi:DNA topoisomerase II